MTKSNTRKWWSIFLSEVAWAGEKGHAEAVEKVMGLPEVGLAELAESNPNYRLAVVVPLAGTIANRGEYEGKQMAVVMKMEER